MQLNRFYYHQDYEKILFYKKALLYIIGGSAQDLKVTTYLDLVESWNLSKKTGQTSLSFSTLSATLRCYAKRNLGNRVCSGWKFWFYRLIKKQRTKYLLIFDDSCGEICNSKVMVDIANAGRHGGLSTNILSTICFIQANLRETLSSKTRTLLPSNLPVTWCRSARLVHSWVPDQKKLIGVETQRLYPTVICWFTCRHKQTIDNVIVQTPDTCPQNF